MFCIDYIPQKRLSSYHSSHSMASNPNHHPFPWWVASSLSYQSHWQSPSMRPKWSLQAQVRLGCCMMSQDYGTLIISWDLGGVIRDGSVQNLEMIWKKQVLRGNDFNSLRAHSPALMCTLRRPKRQVLNVHKECISASLIMEEETLVGAVYWNVLSIHVFIYMHNYISTIFFQANKDHRWSSRGVTNALFGAKTSPTLQP